MTDSNNIYPRFWRFKRFCRSSNHHLRRFLQRIASNKIIALIVPWITGSYYLILDIWGDKWKWISDNITFHEKMFFICLVTSLGTLFLKGLIKNTPGRFEDDSLAQKVSGEFIKTIGIIVQQKISRFRNKLPLLKKNSDKFSHITHPIDQLKVIANSTSQFIQNSYDLKEDQVSITIMARKGTGDWRYIYKNQGWKHTVATSLMSEKSVAKYCIDTGEDLFIPDKIKAASQDMFHLSRRDKRRGDGSAYVYPVKFHTDNIKMDYLISIVTYGGQLCHEYEKQTASITKAFLREFVRRFEIELCLETIKSGI